MPAMPDAAPALVSGSTARYLVKLTPVEPDASALRTIVNFNTLSLGHNQRHVADWTIHDLPPWWFVFSVQFSLNADPERNAPSDSYRLFQVPVIECDRKRLVLELDGRGFVGEGKETVRWRMENDSLGDFAQINEAFQCNKGVINRH